MTDLLLNISSFLVIISLVVFIHEFGHYYVAIKSGVKVEVFSIGMGPELIGWNDKRGTRWRICPLPIGGYVKMFGDSNEASAPDQDILANMNEDEKKLAFHAKSLFAKSMIVAAGPAANFLLSIVMLFVLFFCYGQGFATTEVTYIEPDSIAEKSGIEPGDIITKINDREINDFNELREIVTINAGNELNLTINRGDEEFDLTIIPELKERKDVFGNKINVGSLGIASDKVARKQLGLMASMISATSETYRLSSFMLKSVGQMIIGNVSTDNIGGPIKIAQYSGNSVRQGPQNILWFIAILSINLGLINLFPVPVLDGGHLLFYVIEGIRGRPMAAKIQQISFRIGMALIGSLMIFSVLNDIRSILGI
jgi:regulator of sigma E protease